MTIYLKNGEKAFTDALSDFFISENVEAWNQKYQIPIDIKKIENLYEYMNAWCLENQINYTPEIFLNGFKYPSEYNKENLAFYMNEFIEDTHF